MGSSDIPPSHVSPSYHLICTLLLGTGAFLWTLTYILMILASLRSETYSMPLFSLALNFAWETIFSLYVAETLFEKSAFMMWMVLDLGLIYTTIRYGEMEWKHAPLVGRHIGKIWAVCCVWCCLFLWCMCRLWLGLSPSPDSSSSPISPKRGKIYQGIEGPDTTELGYWTVIVIQNVLSASMLAQLLVRRSSRGSGYVIWVGRFLASFVGMNLYFLYIWWAWPEPHVYVVSGVSICLWVTWVVVDLVYLYVLREVKRSEREKAD